MLSETADFASGPEGQARADTGAIYASRFYTKKQNELAGRKCDLSIKIAREDDPAKRRKLESERAEVDELTRLNENWQTSSTRRGYMERHKDQDADPVFKGGEPRFDLTVARPAPAPVIQQSRKPAKIILHGMTALYNSWSSPIWGMFKERIRQGAFAPHVNGDTYATWQHDAANLFARTTSGTLQLTDTPRGLAFRAEIPQGHQAGKDIAENVAARNVTENSWMATIKSDEWTWATEPGGLDEREILEFERLYDIGPVWKGAYPGTSVSAHFVSQRSAAEQDEADFNQWVSDVDDDQIRAMQLDVLQGRIEMESPERQRGIDRKYRTCGRILGRHAARN